MSVRILLSWALLAAIVGPLTARAQPTLKNLDAAAALDTWLPLNLDESADNRVQVRSAELIVFGPIDPTFDGYVNLAAHDENGEFNFALHEGYLRSSKLIPHVNIKVGKFLLNVGRLNSFHQHDWPFITAPKSHREFLQPGSGLDEAESAMDTGGEFTWLLPFERFFDLTIGVTNGYCFGHCHGATEVRPPRPLVYARGTTFFGGASRGSLLGFSHLARAAADKTRSDLWGLDLTFKRRQGRVLRWLVQSELMYQTQSGRGLDQQEKLGGYVFAQYGLNERWHAGLRLDGFSHLNLKFASDGSHRPDLDYAVVPTITYRNSEFALFRLAYNHEVDTTKGVADSRHRQVELQFVYFIGAHPTHDF